jgi:hypothetical protein
MKWSIKGNSPSTFILACSWYQFILAHSIRGSGKVHILLKDRALSSQSNWKRKKTFSARAIDSKGRGNGTNNGRPHFLVLGLPQQDSRAKAPPFLLLNNFKLCPTGFYSSWSKTEKSPE